MTDNLNTFDNKRLMKQVGLIAGPIALQSLIASSLNLIDNLMIGGLGELALNAVGVSMQIFFVFCVVILLRDTLLGHCKITPANSIT